VLGCTLATELAPEGSRGRRQISKIFLMIMLAICCEGIGHWSNWRRTTKTYKGLFLASSSIIMPVELKQQPSMFTKRHKGPNDSQKQKTQILDRQRSRAHAWRSVVGTEGLSSPDSDTYNTLVHATDPQRFQIQYLDPMHFFPIFNWIL
jgi:hypothetical protein